MSGHEFLRRFCQHVLPKGFHKVRYYGLWHASKRPVAKRVRRMLLLGRRAILVLDEMDGWSPGDDPATDSTVEDAADDAASETQTKAPRRCPNCGKSAFAFVERLHRREGDLSNPNAELDTT